MYLHFPPRTGKAGSGSKFNNEPFAVLFKKGSRHSTQNNIKIMMSGDWHELPYRIVAQIKKAYDKHKIIQV